MYFEELPEHVIERQERVRALFNGEAPDSPITYLCPMNYARHKTGKPFNDVRALEDIGYLADFQADGIKGVLEEENDNTPAAWTRAGNLHFVDSLFGIQPVMLKSSIWGEPLDWDLKSGELPDYDARGGLVPRVKEEISVLRERFGNLPMCPPNLAGPLNGALNVFGNQQVLYLARRDPSAARRAVEHISRAIIDVSNVLSEEIGENMQNTGAKFWLPGGHVMVPWCAAQLVSSETFEEVVRPADEMVLREFGGGILHICGRTTHLIPALRDMKLVLGVELSDSPGGYVPSLDYKKYFDGLRDDQVIIVTAGSMTPERILDISGGERTIMNFDDVEALRRFRDNTGGLN